jgi:O-antigen ligase
MSAAERHTAQSGHVPRRGAWPRAVLAAGWFVLHVGLALAMHRYALVATGHALLTYLAGLVVVAGRRPQRVVHVAAYIVGAEVLWRMTGAAVFWEFGKYATASLFLLAACRIPSRGRALLLSALYFALLLPSIWVTMSTLDSSVVVGEISFNLSGPFLLAVSCVLFANLRPGSVDLRVTAAAMLGPIAGIATLTSYTLLSTQIVFGRGSNFESSGGFGPNQVSSALGLGAVAAVAVGMAAKSKLSVRVSMLGFGLTLISLSALTFSRGGLYTALASCFVGGLALASDRRARLRLLLASVLFVGLAGYWVLPRLISYTQGALGARLASTDPTRRDQLARGDLEAWREHPLLGTGPGGSQRYHEESITAHTEYSRLLAEHGVFGLAALAVLVLLGVDAFRRARSRERRAIVLALFTWSLLFMIHAAMRLAAPAFLFGMAFFFGTDATVMRRAPRSLLDRAASPLAARTRPV